MPNPHAVPYTGMVPPMVHTSGYAPAPGVVQDVMRGTSPALPMVPHNGYGGSTGGNGNAFYDKNNERWPSGDADIRSLHEQQNVFGCCSIIGQSPQVTRTGTGHMHVLDSAPFLSPSPVLLSFPSIVYNPSTHMKRTAEPRLFTFL